MREFSYWLRRYTKSKFFKLILFFIIFVIITMLKKIDVFATCRWMSSDNGGLNLNSSKIYYNFSELDYNEQSGTLAHKRTISYNVPINFDEYTNTNVSVDTSKFLMLKNIVFDFKYASNWTTNDTNNKYLAFNFRSFFKNSGGSDGYFNFLNNVTTTQKQEFFTSMSSFKPYYAEYYDYTDNTWKVVPQIKFAYGSSVPNYNLILILPSGTTLNEVKIYFGTEKNYYGSLTDVQTNIRTENNNINNPYFNYYVRSFNWSNYQSESNISTLQMLAFIPKVPGNSITNLRTVVSNNNSNNGFENIASRCDTLPSSYTGDYLNFSGSLQDIIDDATADDEQMQEEINNYNQQYLIIGGTTEDYDADKAVKMNAGILNFQENYISDNFHGLFSALFAYPLQKLNEIKDIDLRGNNGASYYMNLGLCTGVDSMTGTFNDRYQIRFARPGSVDGTWYFELPCPHYDIYPKIYHGNYRFMSGVSSTLDLSTFEGMWRTIMRGILVYWLYVSCLNVYKYVIDINDTKVEVLEL